MRKLRVLVVLLLCASTTSAQTVLFEVASGEPDDDFGSAIANVGDIDGDGVADLGVGAPASDLAGTECGAVYLYSGRTGALLRLLLGAPGDDLGTSVASAGDVDGDGFGDVLVGAPQLDMFIAKSGKGYARVYSGLTGKVLRTHVGLDKADGFGTVVANVGDLDGDGMGDFAVSAPIPLLDYVRAFSGRTGGLLQFHISPFAGTFYGTALLGLGDFDGDGLGDYAIGDPYDWWSGWEDSYYWIHSGATGEVLLQLSGSSPNDRFASSLASPGDLRGDGKPDLWIGSWGGYAHLYAGSSGGQLLLELESSLAGFGKAVACADVDGDGSRDLLVGAPDADGSAGQKVGTVLAFSAADERRLFRLDGTAAFDRFGSSLATLGDVDGDGLEEVAVGAVGRFVRVVSPVDMQLYSPAPNPLVSITKGGAVEFELDAGHAFEFLPYALLGSVSGTTPPLSLAPSVDLPLVPDAYTEAILQSIGSPTFDGFFGALDGQGRASARLDLAGGVDPSLIGITLHHAFAVFEPGGSAVFASNALQSVLIPDPAEVPSCSFVAPSGDGAGLKLTFDGSGAIDPNGAGVAHTWDFGDGSTATGAVVTHVYAAKGLYEISHRVEDDVGNASTCKRSPAIAACFDAKPFLGSWLISFSGSTSDEIEEYLWDLGDGTSVQSDFPTVFHHYAQPGIFPVTLTRIYADGTVTSCNLDVVVGVTAPPACEFKVTKLLGSWYFDASGPGDGFIDLYAWDFGDGQSTETTVPAVFHPYAPGTYTATLTTTHSAGAVTSTCTQVIVVP